jgi:hypothetical protein
MPSWVTRIVHLPVKWNFRFPKLRPVTSPEGQ